MDIAEILKALAATLNDEGPAVEILPGEAAGSHRIDTPQDVPEGTAAVVRTSGSTGTPKRTVLPTDSLAASSMAAAEHLGTEGQWLLALPVHYVAGLAVLTRSLYAGTRPWAMDLAGSFTAQAFTAAAGELTDKVRLTSLVPTQLARLLEDPAPETIAVLRRFNTILLGGGAASESLRSSARSHGLNIVRTYGMTETCGGCVYDGKPLPGVHLDVAAGRIRLGGDVLAAGYLDDPAHTAERFLLDAAGRRWFTTDDLGSYEDGVLNVLGRIDDVINTGGVKISAAAVAAAIEAVPGVRSALVVGVPDPEWGSAIGSLVTGEATGESIRDAVRSSLGPAAVPRRLLQVPELPALPGGKPDRRAAISQLAAAGRE
ncbi:MAG: AMP-binding protein [Arthrobacter sp.]|uniref:AMP-binding protein n=1 Tax=unclassified Arthrobacter TaxID=235627 RepID=UPI002652D90D|nr:AMP-binding protein [Micrococcaceae bacterium]MDN5813100.1 AMP-binding protein [Micrococcaceae bacterium]MDN5825082.1 AMP-binding protein [Micrococcaceae bacterium]MDN5878498.1 AMP-binding protein [Micrococcaceae bacterium]MDN5885446.1 AMP-binding protein [Micrococcaceae bacterium]